jgi:hypothetical protein
VTDRSLLSAHTCSYDDYGRVCMDRIDMGRPLRCERAESSLGDASAYPKRTHQLVVSYEISILSSANVVYEFSDG